MPNFKPLRDYFKETSYFCKSASKIASPILVNAMVVLNKSGRLILQILVAVMLFDEAVGCTHYTSDSWDNVVGVTLKAIVTLTRFWRYPQNHIRSFFIFFSDICRCETDNGIIIDVEVLFEGRKDI